MANQKLVIHLCSIQRCWEMLLKRSPRLEELKIAGPASFPRVYRIRTIESAKNSRTWGHGHDIHLERRRTANTAGREDGYDDVHMLRSFILCRPGWKYLEVSCFTRPTFAVVSDL